MRGSERGERRKGDEKMEDGVESVGKKKGVWEGMRDRKTIREIREMESRKRENVTRSERERKRGY